MKEQTTRTPPKLRVLSAFLAVAMLLTLLPAAAFAAPAPESDFEYGASNGRAIIRKYKGAGGTVEIPATLGGYPVTGIKMQAFIECTSLKSVSMPESMTWIGDSAFAGSCLAGDIARQHGCAVIFAPCCAFVFSDK